MSLFSFVCVCVRISTGYKGAPTACSITGSIVLWTVPSNGSSTRTGSNFPFTFPKLGCTVVMYGLWESGENNRQFTRSEDIFKCASVLEIIKMDEGGQLHVSATLLPGKEAPVPIVYEAGWAPEMVRTLWEEKNVLPLPWIEPRLLGSPAYCLVTIPSYIKTFIERLHMRTNLGFCRVWTPFSCAVCPLLGAHAH
jgi:hypothetical protein